MKCAQAARGLKNDPTAIGNDRPPGKFCVCGPVGRERGERRDEREKKNKSEKGRRG